MLIGIDKIPLEPPFSRLSSPSSLGLFSCDRCSNPVVNLCDSPLEHSALLQSASAFLVLGAQNWTPHFSCVLPVLSRGEGSPPHLLARLLLMSWGGCLPGLLQGYNAGSCAVCCLLGSPGLFLSSSFPAGWS